MCFASSLSSFPEGSSIKKKGFFSICVAVLIVIISGVSLMQKLSYLIYIFDLFPKPDLFSLARFSFWKID